MPSGTRGVVTLSTGDMAVSRLWCGRSLPNMRLKLSGLLLRESAVASPGALTLDGPVPCAHQHAARSLSAIR